MPAPRVGATAEAVGRAVRGAVTGAADPANAKAARPEEPGAPQSLTSYGFGAAGLHGRRGTVGVSEVRTCP